MPTWAALVDAGRQIAHPRDLIRYFRAERQSPRPRFGALADRQFDRVGLAKMVDVDAVSAR
jgi:hypothetical protein